MNERQALILSKICFYLNMVKDQSLGLECVKIYFCVNSDQSVEGNGLLKYFMCLGPETLEHHHFQRKAFSVV